MPPRSVPWLVLLWLVLTRGGVLRCEAEAEAAAEAAEAVAAAEAAEAEEAAAAAAAKAGGGGRAKPVSMERCRAVRLGRVRG